MEGGSAGGSAASSPLVVGSEGEATTNSSCRPLAEVLAWSGTSAEKHDVGGEEEEGKLVEVGVAPRLDAGEGENDDDAATASRGGGAARREGTRVGDGTPAGGPGPATTGEPLSGAALRDMSPGELATLEGEVMSLEFPNLEDGTGSFGEKTMDNAVKMLMAKTGRGFRLKRENKTKLWTKKNEEEDPRRRNRWSCVSIKCCHGGKPRKRPRVEDASARRNSKSRKVGCNFHVGLWWASNSATPQVSQANICLAHHTPTSDGKEHERPRAFDNGNGVSAEDIEEESDLIRRLHVSKVTTKEIHKALADIGKKLGPAGKQKVRSIRHTFDTGLTAKPPRRSTRGAAAGRPGQVPPVDDPNPIALPHAGPTGVSAYEYAHDGGVALGEELGAMFAELTSVAAVQRVIECTKNFAEHLLQDEKRSLMTRVNDEPSAHPGREEELSLPPAYRKGTPGVRDVAGPGGDGGGAGGRRNRG